MGSQRFPGLGISSRFVPVHGEQHAPLFVAAWIPYDETQMFLPSPLGGFYGFSSVGTSSVRGAVFESTLSGCDVEYGAIVQNTHAKDVTFGETAVTTNLEYDLHNNLEGCTIHGTVAAKSLIHGPVTVEQGALVIGAHIQRATPLTIPTGAILTNDTMIDDTTEVKVVSHNGTPVTIVTASSTEPIATYIDQTELLKCEPISLTWPEACEHLGVLAATTIFNQPPADPSPKIDTTALLPLPSPEPSEFPNILAEDESFQLLYAFRLLPQWRDRVDCVTRRRPRSLLVGEIVNEHGVSDFATYRIGQERWQPLGYRTLRKFRKARKPHRSRYATAETIRSAMWAARLSAYAGGARTTPG